MTVYTKAAQERLATPQSRPIIGREKEMAPNHAGGYTFDIDPLEQVQRFLILGTEGGTYYQKGSEITRDNAVTLDKCLRDPQLSPTVIDLIHRVSTENLAPKVSPALFALAMACVRPTEEVRSSIKESFNAIVRTHAHLLEFVSYVDKMRGWGRFLRTLVASWYETRDVKQLDYQLAKYRNRHGWKTRDVLRLANPKYTEENETLLRYARGDDQFQNREDIFLNGVRLPSGKELLEKAGLDYQASMKALREEATGAIPPTKIAVRAIKEHGLTREMLPTSTLTQRKVWEALLEKMPATALLRNLGKMGSLGMLDPFSAGATEVLRRINDHQALGKARVHPVAALIAAAVYAKGTGIKGTLSWSVNPDIVVALEDAFTGLFKTVEPTGLRHYLALDVSSSMEFAALGETPMTAAHGAAAMAMVTLNAEQQVYLAGFADTLQPLPITRKTSLRDALRITYQMTFGCTDCAAPMLDALHRRIPVDLFVIYTDNESWFGNIYPVQALQNYRRQMGINAKLAVVAMTATKCSIADPLDPGMMDFVGFDASTPAALAAFAKL